MYFEFWFCYDNQIFVSMGCFPNIFGKIIGKLTLILHTSPYPCFWKISFHFSHQERETLVFPLWFWMNFSFLLVTRISWTWSCALRRLQILLSPLEFCFLHEDKLTQTFWNLRNLWNELNLFGQHNSTYVIESYWD